MSIVGQQDRTIAFPRLSSIYPPDGGPEHIPTDLIDDELLHDQSQAVIAFELGRQVGAQCGGVTDATYWKGYAEGLGDGYRVGQLPEDERHEVISDALRVGGVVEQPTTFEPVPVRRAHRIHPMPRLLRTRRPGGAR